MTNLFKSICLYLHIQSRTELREEIRVLSEKLKEEEVRSYRYSKFGMDVCKIIKSFPHCTVVDSANTSINEGDVGYLFCVADCMHISGIVYDQIIIAPWVENIELRDVYHRSCKQENK